MADLRRGVKALGYLLLLGIGFSLGSLDHGRLTAMALAISGSALLALSSRGTARERLLIARALPALLGVMLISFWVSDRMESDVAGMALWGGACALAIFFYSYRLARRAEGANNPE